MTLFKRGTTSSSVVVSSSVYACTSCDHTEIVTEAQDAEKECPKCHSSMKLISSSCVETDKDKYD